MRTIEVSATTVEKAIDKGLMMLGADKENVHVNVLNNGSMLTKAKIEMTVFANAEEKEEFLSNNPVNSPAPAPSKRNNDDLPYDEELSKQAQESAKKFMEGFLQAYGNQYNLFVEEQDKDVCVSVTGENMGGLIGHHGEGLESIQFLLNTFVKENVKGYARKVYLDVENYRAKREATLTDMAQRMAQKVIKNRRSLKLEPMNRYERRVIHTCLQDVPHISTHSEGVDPNRYLVIDYVN